MASAYCYMLIIIRITLFIVSRRKNNPFDYYTSYVNVFISKHTMKTINESFSTRIMYKVFRYKTEYTDQKTMRRFFQYINRSVLFHSQLCLLP